MRVTHPNKAVIVLPIHNDILGPSVSRSITNDNNSYLPYSGIRKVIASSVTILIKVKCNRKLLIRRHVNGPLKCLLIKTNSRVRLMKDPLKQIQGVRVKGKVRIAPIVLI